MPVDAIIREDAMNDTPTVAPLPREAMATMAGIDLLNGMIAGKLPAPPFSQATDIWLREASDGRVVFEGRTGAAFLNPIGVIHAGWTSAILDSALYCCVLTKVPLGQAATTLEFKIHCVRPVMPNTGLVRCEANVVHVGGRVATSEARLLDSAGKLLAHGTETCLIFPVETRRS
jgi:uncharacterized protein (TIGR00369 family)